VDEGEMYTSYETAAKTMQLKNWKSEYFPSIRYRYGNVYKVVGTFERPRTGDGILGITNGIEDFVIGDKGVELISSAPPVIPEKAKGPQLFDINNLYPYTDIAE
jgi:hypothetical protein